MSGKPLQFVNKGDGILGYTQINVLSQLKQPRPAGRGSDVHVLSQHGIDQSIRPPYPQEKTTSFGKFCRIRTYENLVVKSCSEDTVASENTPCRTAMAALRTEGFCKRGTTKTIKTVTVKHGGKSWPQQNRLADGCNTMDVHNTTDRARDLVV